MKGFPLFRIDQMINLAVANLMDLFAKGMADLISETVTNPFGFFHGFPILLPVFEGFPPDQATNRHNGPRKGPTGFPHPGHPSSQSTSRLENFFASHLQLFLQSRKNGLSSTHIGHIIFEGQLKDFL
jgi:hypothetical protein